VQIISISENDHKFSEILGVVEIFKAIGDDSKLVRYSRILKIITILDY